MNREPAPVAVAAALAGRRVVVTRAVEQADELAGRLSALGATVVTLPSIALVDPADGGAALAAAVDRLADYDWLLLTSPNGARRLGAALDAAGLAELPASLRVAAIGPGTARVLQDRGLTVDLLPTRYVAESLAEEFPAPRPADAAARVLLVRAAVARDVIPEHLTGLGWQVDVVEAYATVPATLTSDDLERLAGADVLTFASASAVRYLLAALHDAGVAALPGRTLPPLIVTIGPVTSEQVRAAGLAVAAEADPHTVAGLVAATVAACAADSRGSAALP